MTNEPPGTNRPQPIDPGQLSIREILGCLRAAQAWAIIMASVIVVGGAFTGGMWVEDLRSAKAPAVAASMDPITAAEPQNPFQAEIRKRPPVVTWERFLNAVAAEQWDQAWNVLGSEWQRETTKAENLAYEFRRLKSNTFHYYIPIRVAEREERYLVDYEFEDILQVLPTRDAVVNGTLSASLKPEVRDALLAEYTRALEQAFTPPTQHAEALRAVTEASASWTVRDLVLNDSVIERLGKTLRWTPRLPSGLTGAGERPAVGDRRLVEVVVVKEDESTGWKLKSYDSITMGKR